MSRFYRKLHRQPRNPCRWLLAISGALILVFWAVYRVTPESAPIARGAKYAYLKGCIECHGQPENLDADANDKACADTNQLPRHPEYRVACVDVLAYFESVRLAKNFKVRLQKSNWNLLIAGEKLAREYHCFNCHGQLGQGGLDNSRSFKGYVPGYFGKDFRILTQNATPDSVRQWIKYGVDPVFVNKPVLGWIAKTFFDRQAINMPSFKTLEPEKIEILVNYVIALNRYGPMNASRVRAYARDTVAQSRPAEVASSRNTSDWK